MAKVVRLKQSKNITPTLTITSGIIVLCLAWLAVPTLKMLEARRENINLKHELNSVNKKNKQLRADIKNLNTDEYIELEAREQLGMVKPSEKAYVVLPGKEKPKPNRVKPKSWWQKAIDYVKGLL
ncbi:MAG: septum formation initiator family protein [Actinobacteria bacterium]|nr:MAG: septum formation initiator family protein [Actinomycetota bacterium]